ncbi:hypothetical protein FF38_00814, partial [Lucilia cuprina]
VPPSTNNNSNGRQSCTISPTNNYNNIQRLSCTVSPTTNYNNTQRLSCTVSPTSKNRPPTTNNNSSQLTEILNVLHKLEGHITVLNSKVDRLTVEVISIRSEVSTIKTKVYGDVCYSEFSVPQRPFETIQQNNEFTSKLENEETFKQFLLEKDVFRQPCGAVFVERN